MPRRLRFDFALETGFKTSPEFFMINKLDEAGNDPSNVLLKQYASRILEIVLAPESNPTNPKKPYDVCVGLAVETCLTLGQTSKLLVQLRLVPKPTTEVLIRTTKAIRDMFETFSFALLQPWLVPVSMGHNIC